jgi:hypothetical protein
MLITSGLIFMVPLDRLRFVVVIRLCLGVIAARVIVALPLLGGFPAFQFTRAQFSQSVDDQRPR